jgi:hypothetical protein
LLQAVAGALDEFGIIVSYAGVSPSLSDPDETQSPQSHSRVTLANGLIQAGMESILSYELPLRMARTTRKKRGMVILTFFVAFQSLEQKASWLASEAHFQSIIHQRCSSGGVVGVGVTRNSNSKDNHHQDNDDGDDGTRKEPTFSYFDSATMTRYHYPSKASEMVYCRRQPTPIGCNNDDDHELGHGSIASVSGRGFNLEQLSIPLAQLDVQKSWLGEHAGRGVFSKVDIPAGSYLGLESAVHAVWFGPYTFDIILYNIYGRHSELFRKSPYGVLEACVYGYGYQQSPRVSAINIDSYHCCFFWSYCKFCIIRLGWSAVSLTTVNCRWTNGKLFLVCLPCLCFDVQGYVETIMEAGLMIFVNHGCNGTSNIDFAASNVTELNAELDVVPDAYLSRKTFRKEPYNPATDRETGHAPETHQLVVAGEEILGNYLTYADPLTDWSTAILDARSECYFSGVGIVERYQRSTVEVGAVVDDDDNDDGDSYPISKGDSAASVTGVVNEELKL